MSIKNLNIISNTTNAFSSRARAFLILRRICSSFVLFLVIQILLCTLCLVFMFLFLVIFFLSMTVLAIAIDTGGTVIEIDLPPLPEAANVILVAGLSLSCFIFFFSYKLYNMPRNINIVWKLSSGIYTVNLNDVPNYYYRHYAIYDTNDTSCLLLNLLYLNVDGMIYLPEAFRFNLDRNEIENGAVIALDYARMITGPFPYISYFTHIPNQYYDGVNGEVPAYLRVKCFNLYVYSLLLLLGFRVTTYGRPIVFELGVPQHGVPAGVIIWSKLFCARPGINAEQGGVVNGNEFV